MQKKAIQIRTKLNENESENENESGGTCEGDAKLPLVGVFPRFVSGFVFVLVYVYFKELLRYSWAYVLRLAGSSGGARVPAGRPQPCVSIHLIDPSTLAPHSRAKLK